MKKQVCGMFMYKIDGSMTLTPNVNDCPIMVYYSNSIKHIQLGVVVVVQGLGIAVEAQRGGCIIKILKVY